MIPWVVARELRATLLDYLRSTWGITDAAVERALFELLAGPHGMFQGPYLRVGLPFATAPDVALPLDVAPPYAPHQHQLEAWQRLSSRGQAPVPTLITTGTGSGKTECFLYPLLDHALRERRAGRAGIKAIVLYPMNALASDQAGRFADAIDRDERLRGRVRVGLFVGGDGTHRDMGRAHVIDKRDALKDDPPDILLTNYRMLDLLLQRPTDAPLWKHNTPGTLRYLVLDELHTYDGAQGTDVACLVRRLGQRLGSSEALCPVGTSATVGSGEESRTELLRFAETLFDQPFPPEAFIGETRVDPSALLGDPALPEAYPEAPGPYPEPGENVEAYVLRVARAWLTAALVDGLAPTASGDTLDRVALGRATLRVPLARALLTLAHRRPVSSPELALALARELPVFAAGSQAQREGWLAAGLTLLSYAQRDVGGHTLPLVSVQATVWVREIRRLLSRVGAPPAFRFHDDAPPPADEAWAPRYVCSDCGHTGWLLTESGPGDTLGLAYKDVARVFGERSDALRLVHDDPALAEEAERAGEAPRAVFVDEKARRLVEKAPHPGARTVFVSEPDGKKLHCPACRAPNALRMIASRSTTLSSVAVGHLFTTPLNTDKKLLAFSDSVQDAAHRAGFYGARTYRFALRTAILAGVPSDGAVRLSELPARTWDHWLPRLGTRDTSALAELTALLLPLDLHWLASAEEWHEALDEHVRAREEAEAMGEGAPRTVPEPPPQLVADVRDRLRWEHVRELGLATRIGRTLEQSGCVSVTLDQERLAPAIDAAAAALRERLGREEVPDHDRLHRFVAGLLTRLRIRGGVWDAMLEPYARAGGKEILLQKRFAPLLSPFGPATNRPIFLTSAPKPRHFDSVTTSRAATWTVDWLARGLGCPADAALAADVYLAVLPALAKHGVLRTIPTDERGPGPNQKAVAWALEPAAMLVSRGHALLRCDVCRAELPVVAGSTTDLRGGPCLRYHCAGTLRGEDTHDGSGSVGDDGALPLATYYRRFYERENLGRLWSREHTGLLDRPARESLELEFKERPRPDSPNLLSCTPTLEMGIDIGDLSATLLCSVPPGTAQYVQRVGRAGRRTGNALVLAFAASRPHDLYFFQAPLEAMAGAIHPPGCYLSAPEVLKRQALAFCFDSFARDGGKLPGRVREALQGEEAKRFPKPLLDYVAERRARLTAAFFEMFGKKGLTGTAREKMEKALTPGADGLSDVERSLVEACQDARQRREAARQLVQKIDERLKQLDAGDVESKKVEDVEEERRQLRDERTFLLHQLMALLDTDLWGWLTGESCLPNYAFPERGVKLDAYVRREGAGRKPEHYTWIRGPSAALTELAPFNSFYASARRVVVDGVELKREAPPVRYRFCSSCHHAAPLVTAAAPEPRCPRCGDERWADLGQAREVLALGQVFSVASHRDAVLGDDGEERARTFYERVEFFEPRGEAREAWSNEAAGFGFELQAEMVLRELNLGPSDDGKKLASSSLAGKTVPDVRFVVCGACGQAQSEPGGDGPLRPPHRAWCPERKKPDGKQKLRALHLMRELRSEALRLVVPFADGEDVPGDLANLRAALRVGLRRFYGGDPDFLDVRAYDEPLPAREGRRRYVVIMDRVPGGTGLLAELAVDKGAKLKESLEKAHDLLRRCECQRRSPPVRACYQCLYAYRDGHDLPTLDRERAITIVEGLLDAFGTLTKVDTIGTMSQSGVLESELEARFLRRLEERVVELGGTFERATEGSWKLTVGARAWLMKAQVELLEDQVAVPCRADFVLYPSAQPNVPPIAVFTDGLAYHVMPGSPTTRLGDDVRKRVGISQGGGMITWSLGWKDVVSPEEPPVPTWVGAGAPLQTLQSLVAKLDTKQPGVGLSGLLRVLDADPLRGLVAVLEAPEGLRQLAAVTSFILLSSGKRQPESKLAAAHTALRSSPNAEDLPLLASEGDVAAALLKLGAHGRLLVDAPNAKLSGLTGDPSPLRLTLRLDDDASARTEPTFELSWRLWLRAWNLLQVVPGAALVTPSAIASGPSLPDERPRPTTTPPPRPPASDDSRALAAREVGDVAAVAVLLDLLARHPELEAPEVPLELRPPAFSQVGDVELGFHTRKVAAYFEHQAALAEVLRAAGWTTFQIERGLDIGALERALGLPEGRGR